MSPTATTVCPSCGAPPAPSDSFCEACGTDVVRETAVPLPSAVSTPPRGRTTCVACDEDLPPDDALYCAVCGRKQPAPGDRHESVEGDVAAVTDRGRRREHNEDAFAVSTTPGGRVLAVICDGVSTTICADRASRGAVEAALTSLRRDADHRSGGDALDWAFAAAMQAVKEVEWAPKAGLGPPSCTYLAAITRGHEVELSSMGDCRAFWLPDAGDPETLTRDDSWAADQVLAGTMTSEAARADPRSHRITRWLAGDADPSWRPHTVSFAASQPGRLVLCSDGLWTYAADAVAVAHIAGSGSPLTIARRLVDYANRSGGRDNVTVVVVDVRSAATANSSP